MSSTPYPRFGECIRYLAGGLDSKCSDRDVDRLARKGDFDWSLLDKVIQELVIDGTRAVMGHLTDKVLVPWLAEARSHYTQIVLSADLDSIGREQSLPVLTKNFFIPMGGVLLQRLREVSPGPDLDELLGEGDSPVNVVFNWLEAAVGTSVGQLLYPDSTDSDKASRDKIRKWRNGTDVPSLQGVKLILSELRVQASCEKYGNAFAIWLLIASALARFELNGAQSVRSQLLAALDCAPQISAATNDLEAMVRQVGSAWPELVELGTRLWSDLLRTSKKASGDQADTWQRIEQVEQLAMRYDPTGKNAFHYAWMKARWHVLSGQYEEAVPHYKLAFELAAYRAGRSIKDLVQEAVCVAAFLGNEKAFVKQLKHLSIALGLFLQPNEDAVIEAWELEQFSQQLLVLFPPEGRFIESPLDLSNAPIPGFMALSVEEIDAIELDRRKAGRVRAVKFSDGTVRRWPQLRLYASFGRHEQVHDLLALGASVDDLDCSGGSALLCSIQHAEATGDCRVLNALLQVQHLPETLNSRTHRKRLTPLMCAIDLGRPEVVHALLKQGANADLSALTENQTPLYYVVTQLHCHSQPQVYKRQLVNAFLTEPDKLQQEALRRYKVASAGVFGDKFTSARAHPELVIGCANVQIERHMKRHTRSSILEIAKLLLAHGANPNRPHGYPVAGRTPMMLAAENDLPQLLHLMMEHAGEPMQPDADGLNSLQIATMFGSRRAAEYLRSATR